MNRLILIFITTVFIFSLSGPVLSTEVDHSSEDETFSLKLENKPFGEVVGDINQQTGYTIIYDEKWNSLPISGHYTDVTLEEFFRRVFRKQNTSLLIDSKDKMLIVRFFGDKSFEDLLSGAMIAGKAPGNQKGIPDEIRELHRQQRQELEDYLKDPESVDPLSGMKLVDIRALHEKQHEELEKSKNNPATIDPISGKTLGELEKQHSAQREESEKFRNNPENVEPATGMTIAQIQQLHEQQREELQRMLRDPNTVDPISGKKLSEIWEQEKKSRN